jgi:hypothetical protein
MLPPNNGTLTGFPKLLRTTNGNHILLISRAMAVLITSDAQPLTQDGGSYSDSRITMSSTREAKSWKS